MFTILIIGGLKWPNLVTPGRTREEKNLQTNKEHRHNTVCGTMPPLVDPIRFLPSVLPHPSPTRPNVTSLFVRYYGTLRHCLFRVYSADTFADRLLECLVLLELSSCCCPSPSVGTHNRPTKNISRYVRVI